MLIGLLTFIRSAHYWTLMHPALVLEDDLNELLRQHEELARLISEDTEAGHCEMGTRLFEELETLRDLNERQELEKVRKAIEQKDRQKDLLLKEVDHRIKNSLQIVSGLKRRVRRNLNSTTPPPEYQLSPPFTDNFTNPTTAERYSLTNISPNFVSKLPPHLAI